MCDSISTRHNDSPLASVVTKAEELTESSANDDFLSEELVIASALGYALSSKADNAITEIMDMLETSVSRMEDVVRGVSNDLSNIFDATTETKVSRSVLKEMKKGASLGGGYDLIEALTIRQQVMDGMVASTKYYTNNYFNKYVVPALQLSVDKYILTGEPDASDFQRVRELLNSRLKSVPYWRTVANVAASRSYHYGLLKAGSQSGQRGYKLVVIHDDKTSKVCKELSGREFWIADATQLIERIAQAEDVEEVKELSPWLRDTEIKEMSNTDLAERGVMIPPFHGSCRTTLEMLSGF